MYTGAMRGNCDVGGAWARWLFKFYKTLKIGLGLPHVAGRKGAVESGGGKGGK